MTKFTIIEQCEEVSLAVTRLAKLSVGSVVIGGFSDNRTGEKERRGIEVLEAALETMKWCRDWCDVIDEARAASSFRGPDRAPMSYDQQVAGMTAAVERQRWLAEHRSLVTKGRSVEMEFERDRLDDAFNTLRFCRDYRSAVLAAVKAKKAAA